MTTFVTDSEDDDTFALAVVGHDRAPDGLGGVPGCEERPASRADGDCRPERGHDSAASPPAACSSVDLDSLRWGRQTFLEVNEAHRATIKLAAAANLTGRKWKLLAGVCVQLASYAKLVDNVSHTQLARLVGVPADWRIGADLKGLAAAGIILYVPGVHGRLSVVGFLHGIGGGNDDSSTNKTEAIPQQNRSYPTTKTEPNLHSHRVTTKESTKRNTKRETKGASPPRTLASSSSHVVKDLAAESRLPEDEE